MERIAICRRKYDANVKNVIAKRSSKLNQSDYSDRGLRDDKARLVHHGRNHWQMPSVVFRKDDVSPTISIGLSLHVAKPLEGY